jgi:hypothetical protein
MNINYIKALVSSGPLNKKRIHSQLQKVIAVEGNNGGSPLAVLRVVLYMYVCVYIYIYQCMLMDSFVVVISSNKLLKWCFKALSGVCTSTGTNTRF